MSRARDKAGGNADFESAGIGAYSLHYQFAVGRPAKPVESVSLKRLFERYGDLLWEPGSHKYNVTAFIYELHTLLITPEFSVFTDEMLDGLIASLRKRGNSNATINRKMAALSKLLRKAFKMGDVHSLPEFRRQKEKSGRIRFLEYDEEDRLFAAIEGHSELYHRFCVFLVDSGCRLGEALGLIWNDIQEHRVSFWITKSGRSRTIPMTERVKEVIKLPPSEGRRPKGPFTKLSQAQFRAIWNDAKAEVGLGADDQVVPHILRHTCASRLVQGGIDIRRVQMWLGHQTLSMTMRYAHLATNDLDGCVVVLETPRGESPSGGSSRFASPLTTPSAPAATKKGEAATAKAAKAPRKSSKAK